MGKLQGFRELKRETAKKRPVKDRIKDSKELFIKFPVDKLRQQGARCMECGVPFCNWGCPLGNLIPDWNDMVYKEKWEKAYDRLTLTNNFPEFTGRICPAPCEGSCTLGVNRDPIAIKEIELNIIEKAFEEGWTNPQEPRVRTGKKVAIIGSGPSGLAAAAELNSVGHDVTVFERDDEIGGLLRYGIPDFKLDKSIVERRVNFMKEEGVNFKTNVNVGIDYSAKDLLAQFDAVALTGGSTIPRDLKVEGRELKGVHFAMDYLKQQNRRVSGKEIETTEINAKDKVVLVLGGGDTGSDCIGTAIRQGAKSVYQYEIMPKPPANRDDSMPWPTYPRTLKTTTSHEEGCNRDWNVTTRKFTGEDGFVNTLHATKVEWTHTEKGMQMVEIPGSEFELKVDLVILAMGFLHPQHEGLLTDLGLDFDIRGNVIVDDNYMTKTKGVFAAGDMKKGQSLVVWAIYEGRLVTKNIDEYLMGETSLRG
ncbi:glutamate synthase subunit beta [Clostridium estertheticum]|uniref:glutamate synthase subunit beta n=1 Tax=Clostridium estertheticum TaxID=238834 RepID=UPI001C0B147D|nr:glutamate synthase subunit beta [Clostridium estertheticum]MBU3216326.1 glutamate synthase subunit beta [Clostridium estertheticum]WAG55440.1 glutamate synthase subunit beta [Clostridium estertheticum]